jgi:hypothetical protein
MGRRRENMRYFHCLAVSAAASTALFAPCPASAQTAPAEEPVAFPRYEAVRDRAPDPVQSWRFRPLALTVNPLTLLFGRVGANVEVLPAEHHGIMLNPYFSNVSLETAETKTEFFSWGGELGYHFYTGKKGANGFFIGPSFVFTRTHANAECVNVGCSVDPEVEFTTYGAALDLGAQHVFDNGITLGGGGGLMYLKSSAEAEGDTVLQFEGVLPRVLFTVGYSI